MKRPKRRTFRGLGDFIHAIAHPVATGLDAVLGTDLSRCPSCARRRAAWNAAVPFRGQLTGEPEREAPRRP